MVHYVQDQLLCLLPSHLARFVLDTSVCDEFGPALAAAVSGRRDAAALLDECAHAGLFVDRYDTDQGSLYRWHPFFVRCAQRILELEGSDRVADLHHRAATHLEQTDPLSAVAHWRRAGAADAAARVIRSNWVSILVGSGAAALDAACAALPAAWSETAEILAIHACAKNVIGHPDLARSLLAQAAVAADPADPALAVQLAIAGLIVADDRDAVAVACDEVWAGLGGPDAPTGHERAAVLHFLGGAELRRRHDPSRAIQALEAAVRLADVHGDSELSRRSSVHLAFALAWAGQPRTAREILRAAGGAAGQDGPWRPFVGSSAAAAAGYAAYWVNDLKTAQREFTRALEGGGARVSAAGVARMMLALTVAARGDRAGLRAAELELHAMPRSSARGIAWSAFRDVAAAAVAEARGERASALAIAARYEEADDLPMVTVVLAGIVRRGGDPARALRMLRRLERYGRISYVGMSTLLTAAIVADLAGRRGEAGDLCERALEIADRTGVRRPLCEDEVPLRRLLTLQLARGTAFEGIVTGALAEQAPVGAEALLSARERLVLEQLRTVSTVPEIARGLGVSVNTVKTQQRSIYRKLGVRSRGEAVRMLIAPSAVHPERVNGAGPAGSDQV